MGSHGTAPIESYFKKKVKKIKYLELLKKILKLKAKTEVKSPWHIEVLWLTSTL